MSCPPWVCSACTPYKGAGHTGYDFFDDEDEDEDEDVQ